MRLLNPALHHLLSARTPASCLLSDPLDILSPFPHIQHLDPRFPGAQSPHKKYPTTSTTGSGRRQVQRPREQQRPSCSSWKRHWVTRWCSIEKHRATSLTVSTATSILESCECGWEGKDRKAESGYRRGHRGVTILYLLHIAWGELVEIQLIYQSSHAKYAVIFNRFVKPLPHSVLEIFITLKRSLKPLSSCSPFPSSTPLPLVLDSH